MRAHFITGNDTDVGKTYVTAMLAAEALETGKRVAIYKPVQTGISAGTPTDAETCAALLSERFSRDLFHTETGYCFAPPAAPSVIEGHAAISFEAIIQRVEELKAAYDVVLVEGAGGLYCPITFRHPVDLKNHSRSGRRGEAPQSRDPLSCEANTLFMIDLIEALALPSVLVVSPLLGTLNHTCLSLRALQSRGLPVEKVVVKEARPLTPEERESLAVRTNVSELRRLWPGVCFEMGERI